jgi:ABC-type glutathione transport system ATPase component
MSEAAMNPYSTEGAQARDVVIRARNLGKTYQEGKLVTPVFAGLDLAVYRGETVAIVGASGAGKSTLLHLLGGLDSASSGEVFVEEQEISRLPEKARGLLRNRALGFIYQFHHLLPEFTALENVMIPLMIRGESPRASREPARMLLERVGLGHRLGHKPGEHRRDQLAFLVGLAEVAGADDDIPHLRLVQRIRVHGGLTHSAAPRQGRCAPRARRGRSWPAGTSGRRSPPPG